MFQAQGCRVVNYASNTIKSNLVKNRPPPPTETQLDRPCVYEIPCNSCPQSYFGESGRGLSTRIGEHERYLRNRDHNKAVVKHSNLQPRHEINFRGAQALYHSDIWYNRLVVESTLILTKSNFNNQASTLAIDNLAARILTKNYPRIFNPP